MADYNISDIYQGGYSTLSPTNGDVFSGYGVAAGETGLTTDFRSANILNEVRQRLRTGAKHLEISPMEAKTFESIPKQHFKEARRHAKLIGAELTIHGSPQIEASGITGQGFSEANRDGVERQMFDVIEKSHEVSPKGSAPVVFHSSSMLPGDIKAKGEEALKETLVIDTESGSINRIPIRKRKFPGEGEQSIEKELQKQNEKSWTHQLANVNYYLDNASRMIKTSGGATTAPGETQEHENELSRGNFFLDEAYNSLKELCSTAYNKGTNTDKENLEKYYEEINEDVEKIKQNPHAKTRGVYMESIINKGMKVLDNIDSTPKILKPLNEFAKDKTTTTFANLALKSYKKFGDTAPIIAVENPPAGQAFSTGKQLREVMEESREKFIKKAVEEGMSESSARTQAEKLLGVTLDVGHMNMLRKKGYESKHIVEEAGEVAHLVKHVHLSDNFGFEHTELPMGMGNVPIKEIMEKLGEEGYEGKKIIEAGDWWQHFKTPPFKETLQAFGSPIYSMEMAPQWNQSIGFQQDYYGGMGEVFPQGHFETFGLSFSQLPKELGGQKFGAAGSRVSGRPME
jgi:hypothetical protein